MAQIRQSGGASGVRKVPRSLWERAGARAGDGAGALFARLDAQDAQESQDAQDAQPGMAAQAGRAALVSPAHERAALALERVAAKIRAGVWNAQIAVLVAGADELLDPQS